MYTRRISLLGLIYVSINFPVSISSVDVPLPPLPPGIPLSQFTKLLFSELDNELNLKSLDPSSSNFQQANQNYIAASEYAWKRAFEDYVAPETNGKIQFRRNLQETEEEEIAAPIPKGLVMPFLICVTTPNISGYERRQVLLSELQHTKETTQAETIPLTPIYNLIDQTCFRTNLSAHRASMISALGVQVQPLLYAMKLAKESIEILKEQILHSNDKAVIQNPILDVEWCNQIFPPTNQPNEKTIKNHLLELMKVDATTGISKAQTQLYWSTLTPDSTMTEEGQYWMDILSSSYNERCPKYYDRMQIEFMRPANIPSSEPTIPKLYSFTIAFPNNVGVVDQNCLMAALISTALSSNVCSVQTRSALQLYGKQAQWITQSDIPEYRPYFDSGITGGDSGTYQTVAVSDSGLDVNHCYFWDSRSGSLFSRNAVSDHRQRKVVYYDTYGDDMDTDYGHGTHVAGIIAGDRSNQNDIAAGQGIAPGAKIAFVDIAKGDHILRIPPIDRLLGAGRPQAKLHNMSWGTTYPYYSSLSRNIDSYMYENTDFLTIVAAGNIENNKVSMLTDPATSKNALVVGASQNDGPAIESSQKGKDYLVPYSKRGPTLDGRTKPDVIAPGSWILSAGAQTFKEQECDPDAGGLPTPGPINPSRQGLLYREGTSMSAAVAAGNAALVRQYFEKGFWPTGKPNPKNKIQPSGALVKAVLMNGAQSLLGIDQNFAGVSKLALYDGAQNFGKINLLHSLYLHKENNLRTGIWDNQEIENNESKTYTIRYSRAGKCRNNNMSFTLVWMDPPGASGCRSCVLNGLDVTAYIEKRPETVFYPNGFQNNPETINNAERIKVRGLRRWDKVIVTVKASNLVTPSQNFALVASGCMNISDFYIDVDNTIQFIALGLGALFMVLGLCFLTVFCVQKRMDR